MQTTARTVTRLPTQAMARDIAARARRRNRTAYWTLTLLMFVPGTLGACAEAFTGGPASIVKIVLALGFPLYLIKIPGVAKPLGGIAILTGKLPRMKEWAYAGFSIEPLSATAAHVITGDRTYPCSHSHFSSSSWSPTLCGARLLRHPCRLSRAICAPKPFFAGLHVRYQSIDTSSTATPSNQPTSRTARQPKGMNICRSS